MSSAGPTDALGESSPCRALKYKLNDSMGNAEVSSGFVISLFGLYFWEVVITSWRCEVRVPLSLVLAQAIH